MHSFQNIDELGKKLRAESKAHFKDRPDASGEERQLFLRAKLLEFLMMQKGPQYSAAKNFVVAIAESMKQDARAENVAIDRLQKEFERTAPVTSSRPQFKLVK